MREDEQTRHQTDRQRRLAVAGRVNLAQPPVEEAPVDLSGQPHQRMAHVDDPLQHRPEQVRLPIVPRPRHSDPRSRIDDGIESETGQNRNLEGYVRSLGRGLGVANGDLT